MSTSLHAAHHPPRFSPRIRALVALALLSALIAAPALSAPATTQLEGALLAGSGPVADGAYKLTVAIYPSEKAQSAVWSEGPLDVQVQGGRFSLALGSKTPLDPATLAGLASPYVGVTVGTDPELPRQPLHAAPYAVVAGGLSCTGCISGAQLAVNYAGAATKGGPALDLSCTGCVSVAELQFDADLDFGGNSVKAKNATFSGDVVAKSVSAAAFVGDGSKLTGVGVPAGTCAKGTVVTGIASDGKIVCSSVAAALPSDGLDEISGGMVSTEFSETAAFTTATAIPDNTGAAAAANLEVPAWGVTKAVEITVKAENTDLSTVAIVLLPPDDKKVGLVLCDPCGNKDEKALDKTWSAVVAPKTGDLGAFLGKSLAGTWTLKVTDSSFCIKQAAGNATLCDLSGKTDGNLLSFSIVADVVSSQKVAVGGDLLAKGAVKVGNTTAPCTAALAGALRWTGKDLQVCTGKAWRRVDNAPPTLTSLDPPGGSYKGGTVVTLHGTDFTDNMEVRFGSVASSKVTFVSPEKVTAVAPAVSAPAVVDVTVSLGAGEDSTLAAAYSYEHEGLVAWFDAAQTASWPGNGTQWKDLSGNATHASMINGLVGGSRGNRPAMIFNGSGAAAQFANKNLGKQQFTAVYWVWSEVPAGNANQGGLYVNRDSTEPNSSDWVWFGKWDNDNWYFRVNNGQCCGDLPGSGTGGFTAKVPNGQWRMVHFAFGVGVSNGWKWGVDGANVATATLTARPNSQTSAVSTIGWGHSGSGSFWKGGISAVRFYDRLLSDAELAAEYARTKAAFGK
ncbi:MAG: IPT/TIG domain-containing protein [Deltaproteobacteria bacterium]|nr:IPT/TIG domain-containing protein [Deltaproteobacteria bacterium]